MEELILQNACLDTEAVNAARYVSLLNQAEVGDTDAKFEDIERFVRVLGVTTEDLYEAVGDEKQDLHRVEGSILKTYQNVCRILDNKKPVERIKELVGGDRELEEKRESVREKQIRCMEKTEEILRDIDRKVREMIKDARENEGSPYLVLEMKIENLNKKVLCVKGKIYSELYNEGTSKALNCIREELESTYDEYNDIKALLKDRIRVYENNPKLMQIAKRYSEIRLKIEKKKKDIESITG